MNRAVALILVGVVCLSGCASLRSSVSESDIPFPNPTPYESDATLKEAFLAGFARNWTASPDTAPSVPAKFSRSEDLRGAWRRGCCEADLKKIDELKKQYETQ